MNLIEADDADFANLLSGAGSRGLRLPEGHVENPAVLQMLQNLANAIRPQFAPSAWLIVDQGEIVGLCSLVKSPSADGVDIGYGIAGTRRQRGHATAAVAAVLDWARQDERVRTVRAETSVHNLPSQRVLERNGFVRTGERFDEEDGDLFCWAAAAG